MKKGRAIAVVLSLGVLAVFGQSVAFDFINYDDDYYISNNPTVQAGMTANSLAFAFSVKNSFYWHPLTWLSLMIVGPNAAAQHAVNVILHAAAVVLIFLFLQRATGSTARSAAAAALFGLHPLRVESVAWVAERKDVLFGCFAALTLLLYTSYAERPSAKRYLASAGAFVLALMSKPAAVTIPLLLLVLDYWPLHRREPWAIRVREKLPLLAGSLLVAILTWTGQEAAGALDVMNQVPALIRFLKSAEWLCGYVWHTFWPIGLILPYPYDPSTRGAAVYWTLIILITTVAFRVRRTHPYVWAGWLWFVIALLPSVGLIQAGVQSRADRFTYLPHVGFLAGLVWLIAARLPRNIAVPFALTGICLAAALSAKQTAVWRNSETLFAHTVSYSPDNWVGRLKLGTALLDAQRFGEAETQLREAARLNPASFHAHYNLGRAQVGTGKRTEAAGAFERVIERNPSYAEAHYALGTMLLESSNSAAAESRLRSALALNLDPRYQPEAHNMLGISLAQQGRIADALTEFERAVQLDPSNAGAQRNKAMALRSIGEPAATEPVPGTPVN